MDQNICLIDWERLDMIADGYAPDFIDICREFAKETPHLFSLLEDSLNERNIESVSRIAHQIKGSAANFAFVGVSSLTEQIENSAKQGSLKGVAEKLTQARECFTSACEELLKKRGIALI